MAEEIIACMKCGSKNLNSVPGEAFTGQSAIGMTGAMSGEELCNDCGHFGYPLEFKKEEDRLKYVEFRKKEMGKEKKPKK